MPSGDKLSGDGLGGLLLVDGKLSGASTGVSGTVGVAAIAGTSATAGDFAGVTAGGDDTGVVAGAGAGLLAGVLAGAAAAGVGAVGDCAGEILGVAADGGDDTGDLGAGELAGETSGGDLVEVGDGAGELLLCPVLDWSTADITSNAMRSSLDILFVGYGKMEVVREYSGGRKSKIQEMFDGNDSFPMNTERDERESYIEERKWK